MDATGLRALGWLVLVGLLLTGCRPEPSETLGYGPLPVIAGTNVAVPRGWRPSLAEETRDWKWIVIHHSATDAGGALAFDRMHRARGWDELGYHFVIDNGEGRPDGQVEVGSRWVKQKYGAHTKSPDGKYNQQGIGICLVGNFENSQPTANQWDSLIRLVAYLQRQYNIPADHIIGHRDANPTTLRPGKNVSLPQLRHDVEHFLDANSK